MINSFHLSKRSFSWSSVGFSMALLLVTTLSGQGANGLSEFVTHEDVVIECVASEPLVIDPVAMAFDEHRRMWVAENRAYPKVDPDVLMGQIALLEDLDQDGFYEKRTTFAKGLGYPNGVLPWESGVIVTDAPDVLFLKDTDGDGQCDVKQVLLTGFDTKRSTQLRVNDPTQGPDGWIYLAGGLSGGRVKAPWQSEDTRVDLRRHDMRFHPYSWDLKLTTGKSQYGMEIDRFGNRFICMNRVQVQHVMAEESDWGHNPHFHFNKTVENLPEERVDDLLKGYNAGARIYPLTQHQTTADSHAGTFTAACAVTRYESNGLPQRYHSHIFSCDPTGNLIHFDYLKAKGPGFAATREENETEFVASKNSWFRPVFLTTGPEGALYVCDMRRKTIEHPDYLPEEIRKRTDFESGNDMGRIYRIRAKGKPVVTNEFSEASIQYWGITSYFSKCLVSENEWLREIAIRKLAESVDASTLDTEGLKEIFRLMPSNDETLLPVYLQLWDKERFAESNRVWGISDGNISGVRNYLLTQIPLEMLKDRLAFSSHIGPTQSLYFIADRLKEKARPIDRWIYNQLSPKAKEEITVLNRKSYTHGIGENSLPQLTQHKALKDDLNAIVWSKGIIDQLGHPGLAPGIDREIVKLLLNMKTPRSTFIANRYILSGSYPDLIHSSRSEISPWTNKLQWNTSSTNVITRFRTAQALTHWDHPNRHKNLARILQQDKEHEWIRAAVINAAHGQCFELLGEILSYLSYHDAAAHLHSFLGEGALLTIEELSRIAILEDSSSFQMVDLMLKRKGPKGLIISSGGPQVDHEKKIVENHRNPGKNALVFAAMLLGMHESGKLSAPDPNKPWLGWGETTEAQAWRSVKKNIATRSTEGLTDEEKSVIHRFKVLSGLEDWNWKIQEALDHQDPALLELIIDAARTREAHAILPEIFDPANWSRLSHKARNQFLQIACSSRSHADLLFDALDEGIVPSGMLNISLKNQWKRILSGEQRKRLESLLGKHVSEDAAASFNRLKSATELRGIPGEGKVLFLNLCSSCHRLDQEGYALGPDLYGIRNQAKESILLHIVDPNREIVSGFEGVEWTTGTDEGFIGLLSFENENQIGLKMPTGIELSFPRNEGGTLRNLQISLMPEGILDALTHQQVADLLSYLRGE